MTTIITLIVGGSILFVGIWSLTGIGSNRLRKPADRTQQRRSKIGSVFGVRRVHGSPRK